MTIKKSILPLIAFLILSTSLFGTTFHLDPNNGSITNDGSVQNPWPSLEEVLNAGLIEYHKNSPIPYDAASNQFAMTNQGAPIKAGDTLLLLDGLHGDLFLRNYNNLDFITIKAKKNHRAILKSVRFQACSNWRLEDLIISSEPYDDYINYRLIFIESHNWHGPSYKIDIIGCELFSADQPWDTAEDWLTKVSSGIHASGDSVNIINNKLRNVDMGISLGGDYSNAINNEVINFSGDGMRVLGSHCLLEKNLIKNCYKVDDNHDDGIQSFTTNGNIVDHNILRSNIILNYEDPNQPLLGALQGIGCFDGFYNDWIVENNLIITNHWHGISFYGANRCLIINNTVLDPSPDITPGSIWIRIQDHKDGRPSTDCIVKNNISNKFVVDDALSNNMILSDYNDYATHFVDYINNDFHLKANSSLIDAGDFQLAPSEDIEGNPRGANPIDIGCYEYQSTTSTYQPLANKSFYISPNPFDQQINIQTELKHFYISILNLKGNLLSNSSSKIINTSALSSGVYFIKILDKETDTFEIQKIIKL